MNTKVGKGIELNLCILGENCETKKAMREDSSFISNRGFSLIEVLAALAVMSIALVALLNTHTNNLRNFITIRVLSEATMLAQETMNELELAGYTLEEGEEIGDEEYGRIYEEGLFENDTLDEKLNWREEYLWEVFIDETDLEGIGKLTVRVYNDIFKERVPPVELVTWIPYAGFIDEEEEADDD